VFKLFLLGSYVQDWREKEVGPFRIAPKYFDYDNMNPDVPVLSALLNLKQCCENVRVFEIRILASSIEKQFVLDAFMQI